MATRNEILIELWKDTDIRDCLSKQPDYLQDEILSEAFLSMAEKTEKQLNQLRDDGYIKFYMIKIILNMANNKNGKFFRQFRNYVEFIGEHEQGLDYPNENLESGEDTVIKKKVEAGLAELHWYKGGLIELYVGDYNRNARKLSRDTGIPYSSLVRTLNATKQELKKLIKL